MNDACGKEETLKESDIGRPTVCGNLAQGVIVEKFPDIFLHSRSGSVKQIHPPRADCEVGHKNMIDIFCVLEKSQLPSFLRIFWDRTPDHHKAMFLVPLVMDFFPELSHFPTVATSLKPHPLSPGQQRGILLGHDHISASCSVEKSDRSAPIESRIHPKSYPPSGNGFGYLGQADCQKGNHSCGSCSMAWS